MALWGLLGYFSWTKTWTVESSALEAVCAVHSFPAQGQSNRRWLFLHSQLQTAFIQGSAQKTLGALFLCSAAHAVSQQAQCFLMSFPTFCYSSFPPPYQDARLLRATVLYLHFCWFKSFICINLAFTLHSFFPWNFVL